MTSRKVQAEVFYVAWLYDLAVLERHLVNRKTFSPSFSVHIWRADKSDAYVDAIPYPELFLILVYAHSYFEKGLKYLCLIADPSASHGRVRAYKHNLRKAWKHLRGVPAGKDLEASIRALRLWGLFNSLLRLDHPGLRYLDVPAKVTVDLRKLSRLVTAVKDFLLVQRRDQVYSDPATHTALQIHGDRIRASFSPRHRRSNRIDFEKCVLTLDPLPAAKLLATRP